MPDIHELAAQAHWELEGVRKAVQSYRDMESGRYVDKDGKVKYREVDHMTLPPGKALVRGVVKPLVEAIKGRQEEAIEFLRSPGRAPEWAIPVQVLDPEKAAVITLNCAVRAVVSQYSHQGSAGSGGSFATITAASVHLSSALRDQLRYDHWCAEEAQKDDEAARSNVQAYRSRLKALQLTYPNMDRRAWKRWVYKIEMASDGDTWTKRQQLGLGAMLFKDLVTVAPDRFRFGELRRSDVGYATTLEVTEATRAVLNDVRERAEVARPLLMPMITKPLPWRYEP